MPTPSSVDSGYAELVMHLPKDWEVSTSALDSAKYGWPLRLLRQLGENVRRNGYGLGQWHQSEGYLKQTYGVQLGEMKWDPNASIHPYDKETEFSGAFKIEFREDGKRIEVTGQSTSIHYYHIEKMKTSRKDTLTLKKVNGTIYRNNMDMVEVTKTVLISKI
ncbi:suppressor of fused family protein [Bacillus pseudomycoides]|uniref:suppressor of fused domain protein n=1 Tax=Bacillus TaxID=1386 RepID=UPI0003A6FC2E|nr:MULTISPECIES: suppressor of fused domain protein [Bacillus]AIK39163.1 suppressor of fused family protein [Bacillus pseudomycoides]